MNYLGLDDVIVIASRVLHLEPGVVLKTSRINVADSAVHAPTASFGGVEFHPGLATKIAVLGYRLVRNHPFVDGNKRVAFLAMIEMAERNAHSWHEPDDDSDGDETVEMMLGAAAGTISETDFIAWVKGRVA